MAIDPNTEAPISLTAAARSLPRRRAGKKPHVSCIYRWTVSGCRGVILESIQIGGTRCTSREALARFFQRLTQQAGLAPVEKHRSPAARDRAVQAAVAELERAGA